MVNPAPYGGDIGSDAYNEEVDGLKNMYGKFGFREHPQYTNYMVKDENI